MHRKGENMSKNFYGVMLSDSERYTLSAKNPQEAIKIVAEKLGYKLQDIKPVKQGYNVIVYLLDGYRKSANGYFIKASKLETNEPVAPNTITQKTKSKVKPDFKAGLPKETIVNTTSEEPKKKVRNGSLTEKVYLEISGEIPEGAIANVNLTEEEIKKELEKDFDCECEIDEYESPIEDNSWSLTVNLYIPVSYQKGYAATMWEPAEPSCIEDYVEFDEVRDSVVARLEYLGLPMDSDYVNIKVSGDSEEDILDDHYEAMEEARHGYYED